MTKLEQADQEAGASEFQELTAKVTVSRLGEIVFLTIDCADWTARIPMTEAQRNRLVFDLMNPKPERDR